MKDQFIILTMKNEKPIIIGVSNIMLVEKDSDTGCLMTLVGNSSKICIKDSFEEISKQLGLDSFRKRVNTF